MVRAKLWFRCAAVGDPITPVIVRPALLGWDAKEREIPLTIERAFKGDELLMRMKGWVTVDVKKVIELIKSYGYLKVLDERDLVVELETNDDYEKLNNELLNNFKGHIDLEKL
jgi:hypothetical protein